MKAKEKFWQWYLQPEQKKRFKVDSLINGTDNVLKVRFLALSDAEKFGVYLEFFRKHDIWIEIISETPNSHCIKFLSPDIMSPFFEAHPNIYVLGEVEQAQTEAINKAFEILEERL